MIGTCAQDHETAKEGVTIAWRRKWSTSVLEKKRGVHQARNGWKDKKTEREMHPKEHSMVMCVGDRKVLTYFGR